MTPAQLDLFERYQHRARTAARMVRARIRPADCVYEDLLQEARLAILRAAIEFDPARGFSFDGYAWSSALRAARRHAIMALRPATGGRDSFRGRQRRAEIEDIPAREIRVAPTQERELAAKQVAAIVTQRLTAARPRDGHIFIACEFGGAEQRDFLADRGATKQAVSAGLKRCRTFFDQVAAELRAEAA